MEEIKNFDTFYELKLKPYLDELQSQNKKADHWGTAGVVFGLLLILSLATDFTGNARAFIITLSVVLILVSIYNYTKVNDAYEDNFKEHIIRQIVEFIQPGLAYKPNVFINSTNYRNSSLFREYYDDFDGDDLIEGTYKKVTFKCSEINVLRRSGSVSVPDNRIFRGLFFAAPINYTYKGGTYIWYKEFEQLPASIADERYRLMPMPEVVRVDCRNGEFEKYYSVYGTNVYEASSIVNGEMMKNITAFMKQINRALTLSFVAGTCYVAIPFTEDLFEPQSGDPADKEEIKKYFFAVLLILSIINQLQLERLQ